MDRYCGRFIPKSPNHQVFARKIVRIFGDVTHEDAESEGRMLSELCRPGRSLTVVEVIKHGWLPRRLLLYYIDMEYCPETLEYRIYGAVQNIKSTESASMLDSERDQGEVDLLSTRTTQVPPNKTPNTNDPNNSSPEFDWQSVVDIIKDITQGLIYLHKNNTVHRDLKPKNGTRFPDVFEFILYSPLFRACWVLETC